MMNPSGRAPYRLKDSTTESITNANRYRGDTFRDGMNNQAPLNQKKTKERPDDALNDALHKDEKHGRGVKVAILKPILSIEA